MSNPKVVSNCRLCAISAGHYCQEYDAPVVSGDEYFGLASIGGFIPGWSLLCPRQHSHNLSSEYRDGVTFHAEVCRLVDAVTRAYSQPAIFEHGAFCEDSQTACGTSHAHLHVVPFADSLETLALAEKSLSWEPVLMLDVARAVKGHEYLFVADRYDGPRTIGQLARLSVPRSQFFRRLLANYLCIPYAADYRNAPLEDLSAATAVRVRTAIARHRQAA